MMKTVLIDFLICPTCLPLEKQLFCQIEEKRGDDILSGLLKCDQCGTQYPIQKGIASLFPKSSERKGEEPSKYESSSLVSSYLWSHFSDLLEEEEASTAYKDWGNLIKYQNGFSLDAGCAVGRFTLEMSMKSDFAVGIDNSYSFIWTARELVKNRQLEVSLREEGLLTREQTIQVPEKWRADKVEFIVCDAQVLPFRSRTFSSLASLNLVDKVPLPLKHLKEINRVAKESGTQFLFSDPFSWSSEVAGEENWLGGTHEGPYRGEGLDNVLSLLAGKKGGLSPPWKVDKQGHVWWKIRTHRNHFELIRSCFIKASR
jgi:SAM-dependent methyltransferase